MTETTKHPAGRVPYLRLFRRFLRATLASIRPDRMRGPRHLAALAVFLPPFLVLQGVHWIGFLLDEILFPGYRKVVVREPLFVVGMPRTGTTFLHQALAADEERFTTLRLWELLLAPSITERRILLGLITVDRMLGSPLGRLIRRLGSAACRWMEAVHPVSLANPEEDYFFLLPVFACFLLVVPFPDHPRLWELARFDELPDEEREPIMAFYRSCVQRHLYATGHGRQLLSKNPSFTPMVRALAECFQDARFLCSMRDPVEAVPSLLNSLRPGARLFGWDTRNRRDRDRLLGMLENYSSHAIAALAGLRDDRYAFVPLGALHRDAGGTVLGIYERFGWTPEEGYRRRLMDWTRTGRDYRSRHAYSPEDFGLTAENLAARFPGLVEMLAADRRDEYSSARIES